MTSVVLILFFSLITSFALPAFPGAQGFGSHTVGGSGRHLDPPQTTVFSVTTLEVSGPGSFAECVEASVPRVCLFEVSGCIPIYNSLVIRHPYITVAGQTAPSPGICLAEAAVVIETHDVVLQHIFIRTGDSPLSPIIGDMRDSIMVLSGSYDVIIDHVSMAYAIDETFSLWMSNPGEFVTNVTLSNSFITHSLHDSIHSLGPHGKAMIIGPGSRQFSLLRNLFAHHQDRNPVLGGGNSNPGTPSPTIMEMVNNVVYNFFHPSNVNHNYVSDCLDPQYAHYLGNLWIAGPDGYDISSPYYIRLYTILDTSQFWVNGSFGKVRDEADPSLSDWKAIARGNATLHEAMGPLFAPVADRLLRVRSGDELLDLILGNSGSRPTERDVEDARVIEDVRSRNGSFFNCMEPDGSDRCALNAGGQPVFAQNERRLTPPESPFAIVPTSGYTRLEEWLHQFARDLEVFSCFGVDKDDPMACNGRGQCVSQDVCWCTPGTLVNAEAVLWSGDECEDFYLSPAVMVSVGVVLGLVFGIPLVVGFVVALGCAFFKCFQKDKKDGGNERELESDEKRFESE